MDRYYSDQEICNLGFDSRAAFNRRMAAEAAQAKRDARRQANTVTGVERSGSRFYQGGTPVTKLKAWQEQQRANQQKANTHEEAARTAYAEFVAFGGFENPAGRSAAAKLATVLGYTIKTIPSNFGEWIRGDEARQRFMSK